ncbi:MAG: hypothetical protein FWG40_05945 [Peptococcaceae bacterium]|nr:hypothetical protein [Peptococcaceae bacterium]
MQKRVCVLGIVLIMIFLAGCNGGEAISGDDVFKELKDILDSRSDSVLVNVRNVRKSESEGLQRNARISVKVSCIGGYEGTSVETHTELLTAEGYARKTTTTHNSITYYDLVNKKEYDLDPDFGRGWVQDMFGEYTMESYFRDTLFDYFDTGSIDQKIGQEIIAGRNATGFTIKDSGNKVWFDDEYGFTLKYLTKFEPGSNYDEYVFEVTEWVQGGVKISDMINLSDYEFDL